MVINIGMKEGELIMLTEVVFVISTVLHIIMHDDTALRVLSRALA